MSLTTETFNPVESNRFNTIVEIQQNILPKLTRHCQKVRFNNYRRETRYHLLDVERNTDDYTLSISGRTHNIYEVKIDEGTRKLSCSCPDGIGYCQHNNTICKHTYFVLVKVLRMKELASETSNFFETNQLSETEKELAFSRLYTVWENREGATDYMNTDFINQFQTHKEKKREMEAAAQTGDGTVDVLEKFKVTSLPEEQDACLVCYCEMEKPEESVKCPDCRKIFHTSCLQRWFDTGKDTCVHCRSPVWQDYRRALNIKRFGDDPFNNQYESLNQIIR